MLINSINFEEEKIHNYDMSLLIIVPLNSDTIIDELKNKINLFNRNGLEIVLLLLDLSHMDMVLEFVADYPFINWKVATLKGSEMNLAALINLAVKGSLKRYIMICEARTIFVSDFIYKLLVTVQFYPGSYIATHSINDASAPRDRCYLPVLLSKREDIVNAGIVCLKDYSFIEIFHNLLVRLDIIGLKRIKIPIEVDDGTVTESFSLTLTEWRNIYSISEFYIRLSKKYKILNLYDRSDALNRSEQLKKYLCCFEKYNYSEKFVFGNFKIILLAQFYNEAEYIEGFIANVSPFVDGIIFLDDGSTDSSYDLAVGDKVLMKVRKKRDCFDDLANRNLLLKFASFFQSEWYCFMDIDERFDAANCQFTSFIDNPCIQTANFSFVHIWDRNLFYNASIEGSDEGIFKRIRMFRNIGVMQIRSQKKYHFSPTPYYDKPISAPVLFYHLGTQSGKKREDKYLFYRNEDEEHKTGKYDYLLEDKKRILLKDIRNIKYLGTKFQYVEKTSL